MALAATCRKLNIQTIEVQHGIQGKYHQMYASWTKVPESGYEILPDYFWVWSEQCKRDMLESRPPLLGNHSHHLPIVGGNPWLGKWLEENLGLSHDEHEFLEKLNCHEKVILVSFPDLVAFPEILNVLSPAIQKGETDWFWLLRLHPLHKGEKEVKAILTSLKRESLSNVDIHFSTITPLYAILKRCHYHLTLGSTVCHEATAFGVKTGIIDPGKRLGYWYYQQQIELEEFDHISNYQEIIDKIGLSYRTLSTYSPSNSAYINPDPALAREIISNL
jgi:hypothetical protein